MYQLELLQEYFGESFLPVAAEDIVILFGKTVLAEHVGFAVWQLARDAPGGGDIGFFNCICTLNFDAKQRQTWSFNDQINLYISRCSQVGKAIVWMEVAD